MKKFVMILLMTFFLSNVSTPVFPQNSRNNKSYTIVDLADKRIVVSKPFKRIISLYGAHTENLFSLGLDKEIIGVSKNEAFPPQVLKKPVYSYHDDPEKFIAARPDLVLIRPMIDRGYHPFVKKLEKAGITVVSLQPTSVNEMFEYWRTLAELTGRESQAKKMIDEFKMRVSEIKRIASKVPLNERKRVYFESIHRKMKTFSPSSIAIYALETAGGINVAKDARSVKKTNIAYYGKEHILSHSNEIDVYLAQRGAMNHVTISKIKQEAGYMAIKAVRNNQIYIIDEKIVSRPTLRLADGIYEIGRILYPDLFNNVTDLRKIKELTRAQYAEMFVKLFNIPIKTPDYYHDIKKRSAKFHKYGDFKDISYKGDLYKFAETMAYRGLMYNLKKYYLYPDRLITRKEVAYSLFVLKDFPEVNEIKINDVPLEYPLCEQIKTVASLGIIKLDSYKNFYPEKYVSGEELYRIAKEVKAIK